ncbi:GDP-L-fucose synthase family protein [Hymenobacter latericus]|uniref:GDP-L-fucose synthase family protein n=1 Tax=Hymenobacter sp. YIM 151858-1 TaxID=2987688 RepID=UPI002226C2CA|nr:GDP-L-fucose synthase [Hymenobacter sp. YIM 151858-1]UYZ60804.1 GDP-L-fucose synthase [Hymenobacter sp. YIM 151858-1]
MEKNAKIYVAGHRGMAGSAIVRRLQQAGYNNLVLRSSKELDLRNQPAVAAFFAEEKPEYVVLAAAKVGGIVANNTYRADFLYDNLMIEANVLEQARVHGVQKLLYLGSSCIYPKMAPQPIKEEYLLTGPLEQTNEPYAIAKIAGLKLCEAYYDQHGCRFITVMPTNLYGPGDNYHPEHSHVMAALLRKIGEAAALGLPQVEVWGTGKPYREFLHVDDLADACLHLLLHYDGREPINVGTGEDLTIRELAETIAELTGFRGELVFNTSRPDGTPRKQLDVSRLHALGWRHRIELRDGIRQVLDAAEWQAHASEAARHTLQALAT